MSTKETERDKAICKSLSAARLSTYIAPYEGLVDHPVAEALELYIWNTKVSGAFLGPLHICEVVIRNAISESLESLYGPSWPWSVGFQQSLPQYFKEKVVSECAKQKVDSTGKFIAEMNFGFWKDLFTKRHEHRLWGDIQRFFPGLPSKRPVTERRNFMHQDMERIGKLRNRIAHHEPIFTRNLERDLFLINRLVSNRCRHTAGWMKGLHEGDVKQLINSRPHLPER